MFYHFCSQNNCKSAAVEPSALEEKTRRISKNKVSPADHLCLFGLHVCYFFIYFLPGRTSKPRMRTKGQVKLRKSKALHKCLGMDFIRFVYQFDHRFSTKLVSPFSFHVFLNPQTPQTHNPTTPHTRRPTHTKTWPSEMRTRVFRRPLP